MDSAPQECQGLEKQGKTETPSQTRGDWGDMINKFNVMSWIGACNRERTLMKRPSNLNKVWSLVNSHFDRT